MRRRSCEEICIAAMALADGEVAPLATVEIEEHLAACAGCRQEVEQMTALGALLRRQSRKPSAEDLWPRLAERLVPVEAALEGKRDQLRVWLLAGLLGVFKLIEFVPDRSWPLAVQLAPLVVAAVWLLWGRENPFRVEADLSMEGGN